MVKFDNASTASLSELATVPAIDGAGLLSMMRYIYHALRNKQEITDEEKRLLRADGTTPLAVQTLEDNGTTFTAGAAS